MIRFANKNDVKGIEELWNIAFPEEPDFNKYFFENIFDYTNTLVMLKDNVIVSMAQMMPYEIKDIGKVTYIYGAATNPFYRKQGLMSELLKRSFIIDTQNNVKASILIPANKSLFDFYSKLGYETGFYVNKYVHKQGSEKAQLNEDWDIKKLSEIYTGDVVRSEYYWQTQINMYRALGGKIFVYNNAYAVVSDKVEEIMYDSKKDRDILLNSICDYLKCQCVEVVEKGCSLPLGMIKKYSEFNSEKLYMNLMYN